MVLIRAKANGNVVSVTEIEARSYVDAGIFDYVERPRAARFEKPQSAPAPAPAPAPVSAPAPAPSAGPSAPNLVSMTRAELEKLAEGVDVKGTGRDGYVTRADLIAALSGRYQRRDMRAED